MSNIRILIVDDNEELRGIMADYLLRQQDFTLAGEAANGIDALKKLDSSGADVMLLDMIMPNLDGFGVLEEMQRMPLEKRPKVIAVTALGRDDFICRAVNLGVSYYMIKPIDLPVLAERIREVARQSAYSAHDSQPLAIGSPSLSEHTQP